MTASRLVFLALLTGCGGGGEIGREFREHKAQVMADPGPAPAEWAPDGVLHLSPLLVDKLVRFGLTEYGAMQGESEATGPLGVRGTVAYDLAVNRVTLTNTDRCERCIAVDARIGGAVQYHFGPARGETPVDVRIGLDLRVDSDAGDDRSFNVTLQPQEVRDVRVQVSGLNAALRGIVEREVSAWGQTALSEQMQPIPVGTFGGSELPMRGMRVGATEGGGIELAFLTTSPTSAPLGAAPAKLRSGWKLDLSQASLVGLAAQAALGMGEVSRGVHVEPTALQIRPDDFELGLRLWKPSGRGWWRDYTVTGPIRIADGELVLAAESVEEVGQSDGALLADPLASLGESLILQYIAEGVNQTLPLAHMTTASGFDVNLSVLDVAATGDTLVVRGDLDIAVAPRRRPSTDGPLPRSGEVGRPPARTAPTRMERPR